MSSRSLKKYLWLAAFVVVGGLKLYEEYQQEQGRGSAPSPTSSSPARTASKDWTTLTGATVYEDRNNDGDSFKLRHDGEIHEFRLYFVDAPEKRRHQYNGERLRDQGNYFGGLNEGDTIAIGLAAKEFTHDLLTHQPFAILTRWSGVYDSGRYYAMIRFDDGEFLAEKLTRAGLSRIHTEGTTLPDGTREFSFEQHLKKLEQEAQQKRLGGWASRR